MPATATVSQLTEYNILQGLVGLPSPAIERQWVDCGDASVLLKTTDPRLTRNLSFGEFVISFGIYRDIQWQVYPERRIELDAYLVIIVDLNQRYGGPLFYESHKAFSVKSAQSIAMFNTRIDRSITDTELLLSNFGRYRALSAVPTGKQRCSVKRLLLPPAFREEYL